MTSQKLSFPRQQARTQRFTLGAPRAFTVSPDETRVIFLRSMSGTDTHNPLFAQAEAAAHGCAQVAYLDAVEHRWVEELGGMNLYFVYAQEDGSKKIITPSLTGSLLAGVTRDSLLKVARDLGHGSEEGRISIDQWRDDTANGTLLEVFACGTAAVITPVGLVKSEGGEWTQSGGEPGEVTMRLRERLLDIQRGVVEDTHGWMHPLG